MKWFCSSALCYTNSRSKTGAVDKIKYYRLPKDSETQNNFQKILITTGINWEQDPICAKHQTKGYRENTEDLPDIIALSCQTLKTEKKRENILKKILKNPSLKLRKILRNLEQKLTSANSDKLKSARSPPKQQPPATSIPKRTRTP